MVSGDRLVALSHAVDAVARQLGVVEYLPCIVALDAVPQESPVILPLRQKPFPDVLLQIFRSVVAEMRDKGVQDYLEALEDLGRIDREVRSLDMSAGYSADRLGRHPFAAEVEVQAQDAYAKANEYLRNGDLRHAVQSLAEFSAPWKIQFDTTIPEEIGAPIVRCGKTLNRLRGILERSQSAPVHLQAEFVSVNDYVRRALPELAVMELKPDMENAIQLMDKLSSALEEAIAKFWTTIPPLDSWASARCAVERDKLFQEVREKAAQRDACIELRSKLAGRVLGLLKQIPSFSALFKKHSIAQLGAEMVTATQVLGSYSPQILHPEVLEALSRTTLEAPMTKVLWLIANPPLTDSLDLEEEVRQVEQQLLAAKYRDRVTFRHKPAVRAFDVIHTVSDMAPDIVHFSGHGSSDGIVLRDDSGKHVVASGEWLQSLFSGRGVKLVVLNSCYSNDQVLAISKVVPCVIGTSKSVKDAAAIRFSQMFYRQIADGKSVRDAARDARLLANIVKGQDVYVEYGDQALDQRLVFVSPGN